MTKARTLDVEKVTASLRRAARLAVTGSRDDRNGRFTAIEPTKKPARQADSQKTQKDKIAK